MALHLTDPQSNLRAVADQLSLTMTGNATVTLTSDVRGNSFTYTVTQHTDRATGQKSNLWFVALANASGRGTYIGSIMKDGHFVHTKGSKVAKDHIAFKAFDYWWGHLQMAQIAPGMTVSFGGEAPTTRTEPKAKIGEVKPIVDVIHNAARKLKHPALLIGADWYEEAGGSNTPRITLRVSVAGNASKYSGSVMVHDAHAKNGNGWRKLWGRISPEGTWERGYQISDADNAAIIAALKEFAADPAGVAATYGHRTGACCFCGHTLTDSRSVEVGYGPVCASNYSLPWGNKAA